MLLLDASEIGLTSYDAELTALTVATLVQGIVPSIKIYSDCTSAISAVERACAQKERNMGKSQHKVLTEAMRDLSGRWVGG